MAILRNSGISPPWAPVISSLLNGAPLLRKKRVWPPFIRGAPKNKLAQTLHKFWLAQFSSIQEGTREELSHHQEIYNMHYVLACRTNDMMSTLRWLKHVILLREASVSLKWLAPISGGNLTIKYDCPYYLEKYLDSRKWIGFPIHSSRRPIVWHIQKDQIPKRFGCVPYRK